MKICELKINSHQDRVEIVGILAFAGYKVSVEERKPETYRSSRDYFVVVESKESEGLQCDKD